MKNCKIKMQKLLTAFCYQHDTVMNYGIIIGINSLQAWINRTMLNF